MDYDLTLKILAIVALITFVILAIVAMVSLSNVIKMLKKTTSSIDKLSIDIKKSMNLINDSIDELKVKTVESLTYVDETTKQLTITTRNLENDTSNILSSIKPYQVLLNNIHEKVAPPLNQAATFIAAASKAFSTFTSSIGRKK